LIYPVPFSCAIHDLQSPRKPLLRWCHGWTNSRPSRRIPKGSNCALSLTSTILYPITNLNLPSLLNRNRSPSRSRAHLRGCQGSISQEYIEHICHSRVEHKYQRHCQKSKWMKVEVDIRSTTFYCGQDVSNNVYFRTN
jgi:hypothetical protein